MVPPAFSLALGLALLSVFVALVHGRADPHPPAGSPQLQFQSLAAVQPGAAPVGIGPLQPSRPAEHPQILDTAVPLVAPGEELVEDLRAPTKVSAQAPQPEGVVRAAAPQAPARSTRQVAAPNPEAACRRDTAPGMCAAFRCALPRFQQHPMCVRMVVQGAHKLQVAAALGGP